MNYNTPTFWLLFFSIIVFYWRLSHRNQNTLLLVASYAFYGFWDYRFLFLILISTVIDFIGGLGVAGRQLPHRRLRNLALLLIGSSFLLCSNVQYRTLWNGITHSDWEQVIQALPSHWSDLAVPVGTTLAVLIYGMLLSRLYAAPEEKRRKYFLTISMVANLAILGFFKYCDFFISNFDQLLNALGAGSGQSHVLRIILPAGISFYTFQAMSYTIDIYRNETEPPDNFADFALFVCFFPH